MKKQKQYVEVTIEKCEASETIFVNSEDAHLAFRGPVIKQLLKDFGITREEKKILDIGACVHRTTTGSHFSSLRPLAFQIWD